MRRNADHVFQFMLAELGTEGSIDGNKRLVIRGKFAPKVQKSAFPCLCSADSDASMDMTVYRIASAKVYRRVRGMSDVPQFQHDVDQRQRFAPLLRQLPGASLVVHLLPSITYHDLAASLQDCGSTRSVAQIRSGYHATTKADRRALRAAV